MMLSMLLLFGFLFAPPEQEVPGSIYDFKVKGLDGSIIDFAAYKGKKILIVNTASKCGFAPQYEELEALHIKYGNTLAVLAFPANNFLFQEPGSNEKIAAFCKKNYGVTFPVSEKISVRGRNKAPLCEWLTRKKYNHYKDSKVKWNFQKYLINEQGELIAIFGSATSPMSSEITGLIESIAPAAGARQDK